MRGPLEIKHTNLPNDFVVFEEAPAYVIVSQGQIPEESLYYCHRKFCSLMFTLS